MVRVANMCPKSKQDLKALHLNRVGYGLGFKIHRLPSEEANLALSSWSRLLQATLLLFQLSMCAPQLISVVATADAMASPSMAGIGGAAFFADGS